MNGNNNRSSYTSTAWAEWITTLNKDWADFKESFSPQHGGAVPYVPAVLDNSGGGPDIADFDRANEIKRDHGARNSDRETRGRKRSSTCLFEAGPSSQRPLLDPLRSEEPPRKLPKCEVGDKGKEVLHEGRELYSGASLRASDDEGEGDDLDGCSDLSEEWLSEGSSGASEYDELDFSGSPPSPFKYHPKLERRWTDGATALRTASDELRDSLYVGQGQDALTDWRDEHGENDVGGESITDRALRAPFRPPRWTKGGPRGRYPGRHDLQASSRRGSDCPNGLCHDDSCACEVPSGRPPSRASKDSDDEQVPRRGF